MSLSVGGNGRTCDPTTNLDLQPDGVNLRTQGIEPVGQSGEKGKLNLLVEQRRAMTRRAHAQELVVEAVQLSEPTTTNGYSYAIRTLRS